MTFLLHLLPLVSLSFAQGGAEKGTDPTDSTRQELWQKQRNEKAQHIVPYRQGGLEKKLLWMEKKGFQQILNVNYKGFYPRNANLSTGSGFAPALRFWQANLGGSSVDIQALGAYSTRGYEQYDLQIGKYDEKAPEYFLSANRVLIRPPGEVLSKQERFFLYTDVRYQHFPQEDFFGIGPDSKESDRTDYLFQNSQYSAVTGYQFNRWFGAGIRVGFVQMDVGPGTDNRFPNTQDLFNDTTAPGLDQQPDFYHLASSAFFDFRDKPKNPHSGGMLGFSYSWFNDRGTDQFKFNRFAFDGRYYQPLGSVARVLAVRFFTSLDDPVGQSRVPFYLQDTLGGSQTLRGFREFRFRDTNLLYVSGEYRWEAAPAIEGVLFYDAGKVFSDRSDFGFDHLENSWGFGVRFKTSNTVVMRLDVGHSNEGTRVFFKFAPSF